MRISWLIGIFFFLLTACTEEIIYDRSNMPENIVVIDSYPAGFEKTQVRASKNNFEYQMANKVLFVFDSDGTKVHQTGGTGDASFLLDRKQEPFKSWDQTKLKTCKLYIVANLPADNPEDRLYKDKIKTLDDLLKVQVDAPQTSIHLENLSNFAGLPMIGSADKVDLSKDATNVKPVAPIVLETVYAKVVVNILLRVDQNIPGNMPEFHFDSWQAVNVPGYTRLGEPAGEEETVFITNKGTNFVKHAPEKKLTGGSPIITNGGKNIQFYFYTLEHKVNPEIVPDKTFYPTGIHENEKQRFKPTLVGKDQKPLKVIIKGNYKDHQGHDNNVTYELFLGQNNYDNFYINRNCQLNNTIYIKGITNASDKDVTIGTPSVSVDHRVTVDHTNEDFIVEVERETMLDSHIEIRPIDIDLKTWAPGKNYVEVEICDPITKEPPTDPSQPKYAWARFEKLSKKPDVNPDNYCENGKRKYFTTDLMGELQNNVKVTIDTKGDNRIWVYFDENLNASTDGMRDILLRFTYFENNQKKKVLNYTFRQHDLYPVEVTNAQGQKTKYYIEYYEEYLYNFDPKDPYSNRTEGMKWGAKGILYSNEEPAINDAELGDDWTFVKDAIIKAGGMYDYKDPMLGEKYTNKLIDQGNFKILPLDVMPRSAAEYCYNKNKRNKDGTVATMDWYMPAIGELQEITTVAYSKFKDFQEQFYWSSQTAYNVGTYIYNGIIIKDRKGTFNYEDVNSARATKTLVTPEGQYTYVTSESTGSGQTVETNFWEWSSRTETPQNIKNDEGVKPRDAILRVRAVRKTANP